MAITTTDNIGSGGRYCSVCKQRRPILRHGAAGLVCTSCDTKSDAPLVTPPQPDPEPEAEAEAE